MISLNPEFYDTLAQELVTQIIDQGSDEGVVEMPVGPNIHVIFAFSAVDYTLAHGIRSMNYLLLGFKDGRRDSIDFNPDLLDGKITG